MIVTSGQQHRELMIGEPYLGNREATTMPKPWVKWSYEPYRAQDAPEAFMRAYAMALQPPIAIDLLLDMVAEGSARTAPEPMARLLPQVPSSPLTPPEVYAVLSRVRPADSVIVNESTSTMAQQIEWLPTARTGSFFATASGVSAGACRPRSGSRWLTGSGASPGRSSA